MLTNFNLVSSILSEPWFIEPVYAELMLPALVNMIEGKSNLTSLTTHEKQLPSFIGLDQTVVRLSSDAVSSVGTGFGAAPAGSTAIIPIRGAITKYGGMCNYGVENYIDWIDAAEQSESVSDLTFLIDSPGGQANSGFMLSQRIKAIKKPTLAYVDSGMAASAAYLIASAADKIYVNTPVDMLGSIGAMFSLSSFSSSLQGTKTWEIYSRLSTEKNLGFRRLMENNDPSLLQDMLDENVLHFISSVKANRGDRLNLAEGDPFKGATYTAEKALKIGLIDGIAPLSVALSALKSAPATITQAKLETPELTIESNTHTQPEDNSMNFRQFVANWLASNPEEVPAPQTPEATTPEASTPETATQPTLEERLAALETQLTTTVAENKRLTTANANLLANKPAAEPTAPQVTNETVPAPVETVTDATSFLSETDELVASIKKGM